MGEHSQPQLTKMLSHVYDKRTKIKTAIQMSDRKKVIENEAYSDFRDT